MAAYFTAEELVGTKSRLTRLPAMWGMDTLTTVVSRISMNVANITEKATIHGLTCRCWSTPVPASLTLFF